MKSDSKFSFSRPHFLYHLFFILLFLPACTSTKGLKAAEQNGIWSEINSSGVHEDVKYNLLTNTVNPIGATETFLPDVEKVTWWAVFGADTFAMALKPTFEVKWTAPDGKVYLAQKFQKSAFNDFMIETSLPIAGTSAAQKYGNWTVEVFFKGHRIDRKTFKVLTKELVEKNQQEEVQKLQAQIQSKQASPAAAKTPEDPWYQDKYDHSKKLFAAGDYKAAAAVLQEILTQQPYRSEAHLAMASIFYKQKQYADSVKELDFAIQNPALRDQAMSLRNTILELQKTEAA